MIFFGIDNQIVELRIINYQYPEITVGGWDSNWLNIYIKVQSRLGHWQAVDPSLTTWEVQRLINWFEALSSNIQHCDSYQEFTEPNLSFELLNENVTALRMLRIKFDLELRPQTANDDIDYFVDCIVDNDVFKRLADDLKNELKNFPEKCLPLTPGKPQ